MVFTKIERKRLNLQHYDYLPTNRVPEVRFELTRVFAQQILSLPRLPIPPLWRKGWDEFRSIPIPKLSQI